MKLSRSPVKQRIFSALCEHPYGLTNGQLIARVYKGAREPTWAEGSIQAAVYAFNKIMRQMGSCLRIKGNGGPGSIYRIWIVK